MKNWLDFLTCVSAFGAAVVGGVFFAFSTFVMKALARLTPPEGIAAMQSINIVVINAAFMTAFLGTAVACLTLLIVTLVKHGSAYDSQRVIGALLYLVGTLLVTIFFNVPKNDALAALDPGAAENASLWQSYVASWTTWNHVRTAAALGAAILLTLAGVFSKTNGNS